MKINTQWRYGYYDNNGHWQRTKFCFVSCGDRCDCGPPNGVYVLPQPSIPQEEWPEEQDPGHDEEFPEN